MNNFDWIVYGIVALVMVGSWVSNGMKKAAQARQARERRLRGAATRSGQKPDLASSTSGRSSMEELAARRRRQLQELARQRRGEKATTNPPASPQASAEPGNMTMAERIDRARARAQYEMRAKKLQQQTAAKQQAQARKQQATARRMGLPDANTGRVSKTQQPNKAQARALRKAEADRQAARQREQARKLKRKKKQRRLVEEPRIKTRESRVAVAPPISRPTRLVSSSNLLSRQSLRQAIVLKEVLDRPVALRNQ